MKGTFDMDGNKPTDHAEEAMPNRRRALMLGAATASVVISIRPALAQTQASVMKCEIPVPDPGRAGQYIAADGSMVPPGTKGAYPGMPRPFRAEEVRTALNGGTLPGTTYDQSRAYTAYIRRLQHGTAGFTCFASLQMPRG
jgi:hypothetical protein